MVSPRHHNPVIKRDPSAAVAKTQTEQQKQSPPRPLANTMKRTRQIQPAPQSGPSSLPASSVIPLPKSHIHRTPSELQLADEVRRAEYDDVRMYARLVVGMQSQIQRDFVSNGGIIHPMSKMALQGVVKTKAANDEELDKLDDDHNDDWGISFIEEDQEDNDSVDSPWSMQALRTPFKSSSEGSLSTHASMKIHGEEEDDCVFSLEL